MPRRARRPAGAVHLVVVLFAALLLTACGGAGEPAPYDPTGVDGLEIPTPSPDPADFVAEVDNPWFPLLLGDTRTYGVEQDGRRLGAVDVEVVRREEVAGVEATVVVTRAGGKAGTGPITRYYAQDDAGHVWLLGEQSSASSGWRAGEAGAEAGLAMPAEPRVGDGWLRALVPGLDDQVVQVTEPPLDASTDVTGSVVWMVEDDGSTRTRAVYEHGVGLVESETEDGRTTTLLR